MREIRESTIQQIKVQQNKTKKRRRRHTTNKNQPKNTNFADFHRIRSGIQSVIEYIMRRHTITESSEKKGTVTDRRRAQTTTTIHIVCEWLVLYVRYVLKLEVLSIISLSFAV